MGDIDEPHLPLYPRSSLADFGDRYRRLGFGPHATDRPTRLRPPTRGAPMIIDTDIFFDFDDALAVICAALHLPELVLVVTTDEHGGRRARLLRALLDLLGRHDVLVVAGADLGNRNWTAEGLTPAHIPAQPTDVVSAVATVCAGTTGPVRWVGLGPMTNLAHVLTAAPELTDQFVVTQMGGAINYRDDRPEHNLRLDPDAVHDVFATDVDLTLAPSDVTFTPAIAIDADSDIYRRLAADTAPDWAQLVVAHMDQWFTTKYPAGMAHDPLTLTVALELPFTDVSRRRLHLTPDAHMSITDTGRPTWMVTRADYPPFNAWLAEQLSY